MWETLPWKNKSMLSACLLLRTKANMAVKSGCYFVTRHKRCAGVLRASVLLLHETLYKKNEPPELQHCKFGVSAYLVQENPHVYFYFPKENILTIYRADVIWQMSCSRRSCCSCRCAALHQQVTVRASLAGHEVVVLGRVGPWRRRGETEEGTLLQVFMGHYSISTRKNESDVGAKPAKVQWNMFQQIDKQIKPRKEKEKVHKFEALQGCGPQGGEDVDRLWENPSWEWRRETERGKCMGGI